MAYTANTPNFGDAFNATQPIIRANFQEIASAIAVNHGDFNSANQGKHKFVELVNQASAPGTSAAEGALYCKDVGSGESQLFYRRESNGAESQITYGNFFLKGKAAANFSYVSGTLTVNSSYNCTVTRVSQGVYLATFTNAMPNINYFWSVDGAHNTSNNATIASIYNNGATNYATTGSITIQFTNQNATKVDPIIACLLVYGA